MQKQNWKPYDKMERGFFPDDALMYSDGMGKFYYIPDLKVLDSYGLTDATVARTPVTHSNRERLMAHDRNASPEYIKQRGVNIEVFAPDFQRREGARKRRLRRQVRPRPVDAVQHD